MTSAVFIFCAKNKPSIAATVGAVSFMTDSNVFDISRKHRDIGQEEGHLIVPCASVVGIDFDVFITPYPVPRRDGSTPRIICEPLNFMDADVVTAPLVSRCCMSASCFDVKPTPIK
jgi:hypothetical protein